MVNLDKLAQRFDELADKFDNIVVNTTDKTLAVDFEQCSIATDEHLCRTVACHGGWGLYVLGTDAQKKSCNYYEYGADLIARFLGFGNRHELARWAGNNEDLWENKYGGMMFDKNGYKAFSHGWDPDIIKSGDVTLRMISKQYRRVARNIRNLPDISKFDALALMRYMARHLKVTLDDRTDLITTRINQLERIMLEDNAKQVWLDLQDGTFSCSWQASTGGFSDATELMLHPEKYNVPHSKLIEYRCLSDETFEFNQLMSLK